MAARIESVEWPLSAFLRGHLQLMRLLGFLPLTLAKERNATLRLERGQLLWVLAHMLLFAAQHACVLMHARMYFTNADDFGRWLDYAKVGSVFAAHHIALLEAAVKRNALSQFLLHYAALHGAWCRGSVWRCELRAYWRFTLHCWLILGASSGLIVDYMLRAYHAEQLHLLAIYASFLPSACMCRLRLLQYMLFLELSRQELKQLNARLVRLIEHSRATSWRRVPLARQANKQQRIATELHAIMADYAKLHAMMACLEQCSACSLAAIFMQMYVKLVADAYALCWLLFNRPMLFDVQLWLMALQLYMLLHLFSAANNCMSATAALAHNVHKLRHRLCDQRIARRLECFSLQLRHQRIAIDACGLFTADLNVSTDILLTITTFMLFFIQFMASK